MIRLTRRQSLALVVSGPAAEFAVTCQWSDPHRGRASHQLADALVCAADRKHGETCHRNSTMQRIASTSKCKRADLAADQHAGQGCNREHEHRLIGQSHQSDAQKRQDRGDEKEREQ
jgi:hypothetical protein